MKVTAIEEYGLRCLLLLARNANKSITLSEISEREGLSLPYVSKLLMVLRKAGLVRAGRGRHGGYLLAKPPDQVSLGDIMHSLGEPLLSSGHCKRYSGARDSCVHVTDCSIRSVWQSFDHMFTGVFDSISLADLASGRHGLPAYRDRFTKSSASESERPEEVAKTTLQKTNSYTR